MSRIPLFPTEIMTDEQSSVYQKIISGPRGKIQGPLRAALHNANLADKWQELGALLRYGTSLPANLSEIAILITGRACNSPFEWYAHRLEAEKIGVKPQIIDAILKGTYPEAMNAEETAVYDYASELTKTKSVSDATYNQALKLLGVKTVVELTALVGYYTMVAMTLNCHEIPLPEDVIAAFPLPQHQASPNG
jgi:4-carboxymuconolactone decarboxylase